MDVLGDSAREHVLDRFNFVKTPPFNQKFESFDFESQNYVYLSGSYLIFKYGYIILMILFKGINKICFWFKKYEIARKIGSYVYEENYVQSARLFNVKLFLETYLDICVMCILNTYAYSSNANFWVSP